MLSSTSSSSFLLGIDVSRHNGDIDYIRAYNAGARIAAVRCTVGDYYTDSRFVGHWDGFKSAGFLLTAYHVVVPADVNGKPIPAAAQIDCFLSALGSREPDLPLALDCELSSGQKPQTITEVILNCSRRLSGFAGFPYPLIYTRKTWWDSNVIANPLWKLHPLWVAHYTDASQPWLPRDWDDYQVWQYSSKGSGSTYGTEEDFIDLNRARREFIYPDSPNPIPELTAAIQLTLDGRLYTGTTELKPSP